MKRRSQYHFYINNDFREDEKYRNNRDKPRLK